MKFNKVFSNIRGKTCTAVIDAVIAGETNPEKLLELCTHWKLKSTKEEIALAVEGKFTKHHIFMVRAIRTIDHLDKEIERRMQPLEERIRQLCEIPGMSTKSLREFLFQ